MLEVSRKCSFFTVLMAGYFSASLSYHSLWCPVPMMICSMPASSSFLTDRSTIAMPSISMKPFGMLSVLPPKRDPSPPAIITACRTMVIFAKTP